MGLGLGLRLGFVSICLPEYVWPRIAMRRSMDARCHKLSPELQQPLLPCHGAPTSAKPLKLSIGRDGDGHSAASSSKSSTYAPSNRRQKELLVASMRLYQFVRRP